MRSMRWMAVSVSCVVFAWVSNATLLGPELMPNGTFDTDASGWSLGTAGTWNATEGDPAAGSLQVHDPGATGAAAVEFVDAISPNLQYVLEFRVKDLDGGTQIYPWVRTESTDEGGGGSTVDSTYTYLGTPLTQGLYFLPDNNFISANSTWQTFNLTIDSGPAAETLRFQLTHGGATHRIVYDSFSLKEVIPEPSTALLLFMGLGSLAMVRRTVRSRRA